MHTGIIRNPATQCRGLARLLAATAMTGLAFAPAAPATEAPSVRVRVGDLNLASAQGQRVLERRLSAAIKSVCEPKTTSAVTTSGMARVQVGYCRRAALADVQRQLDRHGLPKLYVADRN